MIDLACFVSRNVVIDVLNTICSCYKNVLQLGVNENVTSSIKRSILKFMHDIY